MNYDKSVEYFGNYRGIAWSIRESEGYKSSPWKIHWCHYLHIHLNQLPEDRREEFWLTGVPKQLSKKNTYIYYDYLSSIVNSFDLHCGCTFYSKVAGFDGANRVIKVGCDYQHYYDEGRDYYLEDILGEVKLSIDSLHSLIPNIGVFCHTGYCDKTYHLESEGEYENDDKSYFRCSECAARIKKEKGEKDEENQKTEAS